MKQKFYSLDLIRILAATLVIIVHTKGVFFDKQLNPEIFAFFLGDRDYRCTTFCYSYRVPDASS